MTDIISTELNQLRNELLSAPFVESTEPEPASRVSLRLRWQSYRNKRLIHHRLATLIPVERASSDQVYGWESSENDILPHTLIEQLAKVSATPQVKPQITRLISTIQQAGVASGQKQAAIEQLFRLIEEEPGVFIPRKKRERLFEMIRAELVGLGPLEPFLADPQITEIMINGPKWVYIVKRGRTDLTPVKFDDEAHLVRIIDRILAHIGRRIDEQNPIASARLTDGSQVHVVGRPVSLIGPSLVIRKFTRNPLTIQDLVRFGALPPEVAQFLRACVLTRINILVVGNAGAGAFTLLNVLANFIPNDERIVTVEKTVQFQLVQDNVLTLEARPADDENKHAVTTADLIHTARQLDPDRILLGECGVAEALPLMDAAQNGFDGFLTRMMANTPAEALSRLESMCLIAEPNLPQQSARQMIAASFNLIVAQHRLRDGSRKIVNITEVMGMQDGAIKTQTLFELQETGVDDKGRLITRCKATGIRPSFDQKIKDSGIYLPNAVYGITDVKEPAPRSINYNYATIERAERAKRVRKAVWTFQSEDEIRAAPTIFQDKVFIGSYDTCLWALELHTGKVLWKFMTGGGIVTTPVIHEYHSKDDDGQEQLNQMVIFGSEDALLYALDIRTGECVWQFMTGHMIRCSPALVHPLAPVICVGSDDGRVYALNAKNGQFIWSYDTANPVRGGICTTSEQIIFATEQGELLALDYSGYRKWQYQMGNKPVYSAPHVSDGLCFVGTTDKHLYAVQTSNGVLNWKTKLEGAIVSTASSSATSVYIGAVDGCLYALDKKTGSIQWKFKTAAPVVSSPLVSGETVYFGGTDGCFYALHRVNGQEQWRYKTNSAFIGTPCMSGNVLIIGSADGKLHHLTPLPTA